MQNRRLLSLFSKDDIPSSAKIPEAGDTFNIVWVPYGDGKGRVRNRGAVTIDYIAPFIYNVNYSHTASYTEFYRNKIDFILRESSYYYLFPCVIYVDSYGKNFGLVYGTPYDEGKYVKIKLTTNFTVESYIAPEDENYPFYIDTEEGD